MEPFNQEMATGLTVCSNTPALIKRSYESIRKFYPDMTIIIVDGSDPGSECSQYCQSIKSMRTRIMEMKYNIGHGRGMNAGMAWVATRLALIFDSDIEMIAPPLEEMYKMMKPDTYGVGWIEIVGSDGFEYGVHEFHKQETPTRYLHPYFQLISVKKYFEYPPYVHHGAPCFKTMNAIKKAGLSEQILLEFEGLGHTQGEGFNWRSRPSPYVLHETHGTRKDRRAKGIPEIEPGWEK